MEKEIKIKSISHDELVQIFSDATYGNFGIDVYIPEEYQHLKNSDVYEENIANVLLNGGAVMICDLYSIDDGVQEPYKGNWMGFQLDKYEGSTNEYFCAYKVNLQNLLDGWRNPEAIEYLLDIENGNDDMYTGYNLIQIAVFGEIIYG